LNERMIDVRVQGLESRIEAGIPEIDRGTGYSKHQRQVTGDRGAAVGP